MSLLTGCAYLEYYILTSEHNKMKLSMEDHLEAVRKTLDAA
jgi:hypothetical protein